MKYSIMAMCLVSVLSSCRTASHGSEADAGNLESAAVTSATGTYNYHCTNQSTGGGGFFSMSAMDLIVKAKTVTVIDKENNTKSVGTIKAWKEPDKHKGATQYEGFDGISMESGVYTAVMDTQMLQGAATGHIDLRWQGEGFDHGYFKCDKK